MLRAPSVTDAAMKIEYQIIHSEEFNSDHRKLVAEMLAEQGKVKGNLKDKIDRCKLLCIVKVDDKVVAIGAIKKQTKSDFNSEKAGLPSLSDEFKWELGYLYTRPDYGRKGVGSNVVKLLIDNYGNGRLMASTEIAANPAMVKILERNGFRSYGKPWTSGVHDHFLGLFLKF